LSVSQLFFVERQIDCGVASMLSNTRLNLLPMHRLASGLRRIYSFRRPEKNTFIHYDGQTNEDDQADIVKCVSNLLDGTPSRWKDDEVLSGHLESIVSSYQASALGVEESPQNPLLMDWVVSPKSSSTTFNLDSPSSSADPSPTDPSPVQSSPTSPYGESLEIVVEKAFQKSVKLWSDEVDESLDEISDEFCRSLQVEDNLRIPAASWSMGAAGHAAGSCKPCGWNNKPGGCAKGADCEFCHMCDDGALKRKKKARLQRIKQSKQAKAAQDMI
jgi:hypothetical protein